uniref:asparagine synthase (glutamine-hydrolyzing) n=1 Tax=viral metagenome TaxID=1070528 RepID=A0A6C0KTF0_9ZZZZ
MCGIFCLLNNDNHFKSEFIEKQFKKGKGRGPEHSKLTSVSIKALFGFHRLAINGLNSESNQPIVDGNIILICNGEIYNYKELYKMLDVKPNTDSDCEVIIHLYKKYGIDHTLQLLDGVFSFILCDNKIYNTPSQIYIARDPYGVRPLYILRDCSNEKGISKSRIFGFASELKVLSEFTKFSKYNFVIEHFEPGTYSVYSQKFQVMSKWKFSYERKYHSTGFNINPYCSVNINKEIQHYLISAVKKRVIVTDRPVACLLSGGLDSSLITALVNQIHKQENGPDKKLETYSIGLEGSEDLKYARLVSDYLGTNHTEILLTEQDFIDAIPEVIYTIESYDTTTVRASIGNYLLGKYISQNSDAKVIFNGDGSDELCGGYLYMHKAPNQLEFDYECRRLLNNIYAFDVLRSDKCISSHGLEPRTPFLDRSWVQFYLGIDPKLRFHPGEKQCEKYLLRNAFCKENYLDLEGKSLLPDEVIWRKKEAFSDGVSKTTRSLYQIIQEYIETQNRDYNNFEYYTHNTPSTDEQKYYRKLFEEYYTGLSNVVPYFWMPRYINANDASARTLDFYNNPTDDSA